MLTSRSLLRALFASALCAVLGAAAAQEGALPPPAALALDNVPPVSATLAAQVAKYTEFKPTGFADWHPTKPEMLVVRRHKNTAQLYRVAHPGAPLELLTDYPEPVSRAKYHPKSGKYYGFAKDSGGNEVYRGYLRASSGGDAVPVTPDGQRVQGMAWSTSGKQIVFVTVPVGRTGSADQISSTIWIADPLKPEDARKLAELPGGGWSGFHFSPDDKQLVYLEYVSINESYVWLVDAAKGKSRRILGKNGADTVAYSNATFSKDGKGLYVLSDAGSEFTRLTYVDLATLKPTTLTPGINWDVTDLALSEDNKLVAFIVNEDGTSVLRLMRTNDRKLLAPFRLPLGTIDSIAFHKNSRDLALAITSANGPSEVYAVDVKTNAVTRWTTHEKTEVDPGKFVSPDIVRWPSFDSKSISGFLYRAPAARFPGKRPVLINIHGGPEAQSTADFLGRSNYFIDEMGISVIYPNVRGSAGYGKSFLKLDNGALREDSVKDIGALLDWIARQPDLDASRVAVMGGSYGGYMTLAVSTNYADRIAASVDIVGISNFVTFLEKTESYRRDLRRVEYGDERDPAMRKVLESISPLNNAAKITKPLFVIQGKNDPRVPYYEAEQIVATVKKNATPVWYMLANDEGHGFRKKPNADYQFYSTIGFLNQYLLGK